MVWEVTYKETETVSNRINTANAINVLFERIPFKKSRSSQQTRSIGR
jgi:hypothetical protein